MAPATVEGGRLRTPWGDLGRASGTAAAVLVRPEGVRPDPSGAIRGTVTGRTFAGARTLVRVAVADAPDLDLELPGDGVDVPPVGAEVRLSVEAEAVLALPA